jgi:hypothetical protein
MYDGKTQLLIENPINRYLINSPMLPMMKRDAQGGLTLYLQKDSPGAAQESNWPPAPDGPIYLVMRLYWPTDTPPSILPPGEGTWQPQASSARSHRHVCRDDSGRRGSRQGMSIPHRCAHAVWRLPRVLSSEALEAVVRTGAGPLSAAP